jgi:hypothetical protein
MTHRIAFKLAEYVMKLKYANLTNLTSPLQEVDIWLTMSYLLFPGRHSQCY